MYIIKLKIADVVIALKSQFKMEPLNRTLDWRYKHFIYKSNKKPQILLWVEIKKNPRPVMRKERIFQTTHPLSGQNNWSLFKKNGIYVIKQYLPANKQCAILNKDFNQGTIYLLSDNNGKLTWRLQNIIYDLLQIILINYLSDKQGVFVHSIGLKDIDKKGLLFVGQTHSGKSTTARLWHKYTKAKVLNDDRIVVKRIKNRYFIYGTPWHGDFDDYLRSSPDKAELTQMFFIHHHHNNSAQCLSPKEAFKYLYPNIFPTFWDKKSLERQINLCQDLVNNIQSFRLGFKKDESIISFVRSTK